MSRYETSQELKVVRTARDFSCRRNDGSQLIYFMNEQLQSISDEQKERWNMVSNAWKKWNEFTMNFLKPMGDAIIKALDIKSNDVVLDIASGTVSLHFLLPLLQKTAKFMQPICLRKCSPLHAIMQTNMI